MEVNFHPRCSVNGTITSFFYSQNVSHSFELWIVQSNEDVQ